MSTHKSSADVCPCGSGLAYAACCGRFLDAHVLPETAEALMRSRYTAYARGDADYLRATWHASTRPEALDLAADAAEKPKWIGLDVRAAQRQSEEWASVEFVARYRVGGRAHRLHERSRFVRDAGRWYYVDGDLLE